jgi:putative phosphoesterase
MQILVISDIHDNESNLVKCLDWAVQNKLDEAICCGDVTNADTIGLFASKFSSRIHLVRGNADNYDAGKLAGFKNLKYYGRTGRFSVDGLAIGLCHEPFLLGDVLRLGSCGFVLYGHTHKPWIDNRDGVIVANPGTLGAMFQKATFAVLDTATKKLELKVLEMM